MITVNIHEAKAKLSEYIDAAVKGERVLICRHNRPVAELRAIEATRTAPRDLSPMYPGAAFTTDAFFEPLSARDLDAWEGHTGAAVAKVAEPSVTYAPKGGARRTRKARR